MKNILHELCIFLVKTGRSQIFPQVSLVHQWISYNNAVRNENEYNLSSRVAPVHQIQTNSTILYPDPPTYEEVMVERIYHYITFVGNPRQHCHRQRCIQEDTLYDLGPTSKIVGMVEPQPKFTKFAVIGGFSKSLGSHI